MTAEDRARFYAKVLAKGTVVLEARERAWVAAQLLAEAEAELADDICFCRKAPCECPRAAETTGGRS